MNSDSIESIALHIMRHLVRGLDKTQGHGASFQKFSALVDSQFRTAE